MVHAPRSYYARVQYRLCRRRRRAARTSRKPLKLDIFGPLRTIGSGTGRVAPWKSYSWCGVIMCCNAPPPKNATLHQSRTVDNNNFTLCETQTGGGANALDLYPIVITINLLYGNIICVGMQLSENRLQPSTPSLPRRSDVTGIREMMGSVVSAPESLPLPPNSNPKTASGRCRKHG